jgi:thiamine-phosphate pyrophosphorylase
MASDIADRRPGELDLLLRAARRMRSSGRCAGSRLPLLVFLTDPERTPDPEAVAERLPRGSAVVFRAFGKAGAVEAGRRLGAVTRRRGLRLLAGADPALALAIGADGVHLPERLSHRAAALRRARPDWLVTAAAHGTPAVLKAARAGAHAVLLSPVFESRSPSAGRPLTPLRFAAMTRQAPVAVYALGGVDGRTALKLIGSGAVGVAAIEAFSRIRT